MLWELQPGPTLALHRGPPHSPHQQNFRLSEFFFFGLHLLSDIYNTCDVISGGFFFFFSFPFLGLGLGLDCSGLFSPGRDPLPFYCYYFFLFSPFNLLLQIYDLIFKPHISPLSLSLYVCEILALTPALPDNASALAVTN